MDIVKTAEDIAQSCNEQKFNIYIEKLSRESFSTQMHVCHEAFRGIDTFLNMDPLDHRVFKTLLAIPVEIAHFHERSLNQYLSREHSERLIESIASQFLARSNENNTSLRMSAILFFSHISNQPQWKTRKVLERFGENLLNTLFQLYTNDKKVAPVASQFLMQNLQSFLSISPEMAAMTNSFLQNYMFKHPSLFITFIVEYKNYLLHTNQNAEFFVVHLSFIMQQAFELDHEILSFNILKLLNHYITSLDDKTGQQYFAVLANIMIQSKNLRGRDIGVYIQKELKLKRKPSFKYFLRQFTVGFGASLKVGNLNKSGKKEIKSFSLFQKIFALCQ